jgi:hypothetical protein
MGGTSLSDTEAKIRPDNQALVSKENAARRAASPIPRHHAVFRGRSADSEWAKASAKQKVVALRINTI